MFKLDPAAASAADVKGGFISESGKYIGTFTRAEWMKKEETGSTGIGFTFKSNAGVEAQFYVNIGYIKDGTQETNEGGYRLLNAIMACMKVREIPDPVKITVEKWDSATQAKGKFSVLGFPVLMNKPIGLLLQMEIEKNSKKGNPRPTIYAPFNADTEKTASEVLQGDKCQQPAVLEKMVSAVAAKPLIDRRTHHQNGVITDGPAPRGDFDDFDSDIPF